MKGLGACHALELGFMFGIFRVKGAAPFFGSGPEAETLANAMMDAWVAFAKTGDPGWAPYDAASRATMIFGDGGPHVVNAPAEARRKAWDSVDAARVGG